MGRPGEEHIAEVEDEVRRFRKGHDYLPGGGIGGKGWGWLGEGGENRDILIGTRCGGDNDRGGDGTGEDVAHELMSAIENALGRICKCL